MTIPYNIPPVNMPIADAQGRVSREWYLFLSTLLQSAGGPAVQAGITSLTAVSAKINSSGPVFITDDTSAEEPVLIPGMQGLQGLPGALGVLLLSEETNEGEVFQAPPNLTPLGYIGHLVGTTGVPTAIVGAGAGTGATVSLVGTDLAFRVTLVTGVAPIASSIAFTVTFNTSYGTNPRFQLTAANASSALLSGVTMVWPTTTTTTFVLNTGPTGLTAPTTYIWECAIIQ